MLASAADRGRLSRAKSVARVIPDLTKVSNLRKTSVQRLLDGRTGLTWSADDRRQWRDATGWSGSGASSPGVRAWLNNRRAWPRNADLPVAEGGAPEGELLTWTLERASKKPVSRVLCESVLAAIGAEDEAFWATDAAGTELADGLALSLRDFARLGAALIDARAKSGGSSVAPKWFIESLAAAVTHKDRPATRRLAGLGRRHRLALPIRQPGHVAPGGNRRTLRQQPVHGFRPQDRRRDLRLLSPGIIRLCCCARCAMSGRPSTRPMAQLRSIDRALRACRSAAFCPAAAIACALIDILAPLSDRSLP